MPSGAHQGVNRADPDLTAAAAGGSLGTSGSPAHLVTTWDGLATDGVGLGRLGHHWAAAGPWRITARTRSAVARWAGNSTSHQVAPAAAYGAGSLPGGRAATTS